MKGNSKCTCEGSGELISYILYVGVHEKLLLFLRFTSLAFCFFACERRTRDLGGVSVVPLPQKREGVDCETII